MQFLCLPIADIAQRKRTMRKTILLVLLLVSSDARVGRAQESASRSPDAAPSQEQSESSPELAAIRAGSEQFVAAFNKGDAKAIAALWTEDGEYVDDSGRRFAGRTEIEKVYTDFFAANPEAKIQIAIDSLRQTGPNVAIEDGRAVVDPAPVGDAGVSSYTAVHAKVDGKWLMASVRDTWIAAPASNRAAADLAWLIGTWEAEEYGVKMESVCRWVASDRFIERQYTTTRHDGTKASGVQLIGWNPQGGHVQSWDFSPDGGHAVGVWTPIDGGWQARVVGTTGDGTSTMAVNRLIRLDDNAYAWQSVGRFLGETALPDTDEVVIKRQRAS
jgi:uncharacterized protein (TIGR02246 family)